MKILITGGCGFIGSNLAIFLKKKKYNIYSLDNLFRKGSSYNQARLKNNNIKNYKIDITNFKNFKKLPRFDLIIDCCAEPSVNASLVEIDRVINTNLIGTLNILKKCSSDKSKLIFLSSSRVYSLNYLKKLKSKKKNSKIQISVSSPTNEAKSIYGFSKHSSEYLIKEFAYIYKIKFIINRLGVVAGPWQFGKVDQGFFSLWVWKHITKAKLTYKGFGGNGNQIRDILHVDDLCILINKQIKKFSKVNNLTLTAGGGLSNSISLRSLTKICQSVTGNQINIKKQKSTSIYDIPYFVTSNQYIKKIYGWSPKKNIKDICIDLYQWQKKNINILRKIL